MTREEIDQHKSDIDKLSQFEMATLWRFSPSGHPYFNTEYNEIHEHFVSRFDGFTPKLSRAIGW